ncbi:unnamed protein product, partial [Musa textilis]
MDHKHSRFSSSQSAPPFSHSAKPLSSTVPENDEATVFFLPLGGRPHGRPTTSSLLWGDLLFISFLYKGEREGVASRTLRGSSSFSFCSSWFVYI